MLQLTSDAAATLAEACREEGMGPDEAGVRVSGSVNEGGGLSLEVTLQEEPEPTDAVSEHEGLRLFVASEVAQALSDLELAIAEGGQEGQTLQLQEQGTAG